MKNILLSLVLLFSPITVYAAPEPIAFKILPNESSISFDVIQGDEHVTGNFAKFTGDISFHPEALSASKASVVIAMDSVKSDTTGVADNLKKGEYFETSAFPEAKFVTQSFKSLGNQRYEAKAQLTIKKYTEPVTLTFKLDEFNESSASMTGEAVLKRTKFHVGLDNDNTIKDDVKVMVKVKASAIKK